MTKKFRLLLVLALIAAAVSVMSASVSAENYGIGPGKDFKSLSDALSALPRNAGDVTLMLSGTIDERSIIQVPSDRGITSITIDAEKPVNVKGEGVEFICNGIPFILGKNVTMAGTTVYGGAFTINGEQKFLDSSSIKILGTVGNVFAGGKSEGPFSVSDVTNGEIEVEGRLLHSLNGGGFANGGSTTVSNSKIIVSPDGLISGNIYFGGMVKAIFIIDGSKKRAMGAAAVVEKAIPLIKGKVAGKIIENGHYSPDEQNPSRMEFFEVRAISYDSKDIGIKNTDVQIIDIGPNTNFPDLNKAFYAIDPGPHEVIFRLKENMQQGESAEVIFQKGITKLTFEPADPNKEKTINFMGNDLYAGCIPLVIEKNFLILNGNVFGGKLSDKQSIKSCDQSDITVKGRVSNVYGGGKAIGRESVSVVKRSSIWISGEVLKDVRLGGFGNNGGQTATGASWIQTDEGSSIKRNLYYTGLALGNGTDAKNSTAQVGDVWVNLSGKIYNQTIKIPENQVQSVGQSHENSSHDEFIKSSLSIEVEEEPVIETKKIIAGYPTPYQVQTLDSRGAGFYSQIEGWLERLSPENQYYVGTLPEGQIVTLIEIIDAYFHNCRLGSTEQMFYKIRTASGQVGYVLAGTLVPYIEP